MGLLLMTRFTLQEAVRRRLFLTVIILSIILLIAFTFIFNAAVNVLLSSKSVGTISQFDYWAAGIFVSVPAIWMVYLLSGVMTIFSTVNMISGEIEAGTFVIIVPKPLRRYEIVLGKWSGYALLLTSYTACLFYAFLSIIYWRTGYWPSQALNALGMLELGVLSLLGLTTLGSTLFPTIVNGAIVVILFIGAPIASFVAGIVQFTQSIQKLSPVPNDSLQNISTVINLIIPTDALWHGTSYYLLPPVALNLLGGAATVFSLPLISAERVTGALLIWIILYIIIFPALAVWRFQTRDL